VEESFRQIVGARPAKLILTLLGLLLQSSVFGVEANVGSERESVGMEEPAAPRPGVLGIPQPSFGGHSPTEFFDQRNPDNESGERKRTADGSLYTHFVDNSHAKSTDWSNTFGTTERPRKTLPRDISAGSIVEIRGGPYETSDISLNGMRGTKERPIFIHGDISKPLIRHIDEGDAWTLRIENASYVNIENLHFDGSELPERSRKKPSAIMVDSSDHISLNSIEVSDYPNTPPRSYRGVMGVRNSEFVLLTNSEIHHNGEYPPSYENGRHGFVVASGSKYIWIIGNSIHHNGEDGIHVIRNGSRDKSVPEHVYIGGNRIFNNGENAIDIKQSKHVIVSGNDMYNYSQAPRSDGSAVVINNNPPNEKVWIMFNTIHDSTNGIRDQVVGGGDAYLIANVIYNIDDTAIISFGGPATHYCVDNTIYKVGRTGIEYQGAGELHLSGNVVVQAARSPVRVAPRLSGEYVGQTIVYYPKKSNSSSDRLRGDLRIVDPGFVDSKGLDFRILPTGAAREATEEHEVYSLFYSLYSLDIRYDIVGTRRPEDTSWTAGAYQ
jgi:hypothetical protein